MEINNIEQLFSEGDNEQKKRTILPANSVNEHYVNICKLVIYIVNSKIDIPTEEIMLNVEQKGTIKNLSMWLCGSFKPQRGILLVGSIGSGKTTIMQAFMKYYSAIYRKIVNQYHSKQLPLAYKKEGIEFFYKRPLFIDDLGKESPITTDWGQRFDTWADLFSIRYENRALTFATANYKLDGQFKEIYGDVIVDRMVEHFNIFELKGHSFRK